MSHHDESHATARADLCRFLAACYYEPDPAFAEEQLFERMLEAASHGQPQLAQRTRTLGETFANEGPARLLVDYARLFLGPPHPLAAPYGSVWLEDDGKVMGESTIAVAELYRELGFELDDNFREPPDHIAAELEFLYVAIFRENAARRSGDEASRKRAMDVKQRFLDQHLARWVQAFATAVGSGAQSRFYPELAELTARFVATERHGAHVP